MINFEFIYLFGCIDMEEGKSIVEFMYFVSNYGFMVGFLLIRLVVYFFLVGS